MQYSTVFKASSGRKMPKMLWTQVMGGNCRGSRGEEGCIRFDLLRAGNKFMTYEAPSFWAIGRGEAHGSGQLCQAFGSFRLVLLTLLRRCTLTSLPGCLEPFTIADRETREYQRFHKINMCWATEQIRILAGGRAKLC